MCRHTVGWSQSASVVHPHAFCIYAHCPQQFHDLANACRLCAVAIFECNQAKQHLGKEIHAEYVSLFRNERQRFALVGIDKSRLPIVDVLASSCRNCLSLDADTRCRQRSPYSRSCKLRRIRHVALDPELRLLLRNGTKQCPHVLIRCSKHVCAVKGIVG